MSEKIIYVGIDVDDKAFHATALIKSSGDFVELKSRPAVRGLSNKIAELQEKYSRHKIKLCYEASYIGFSLQHKLAALGHECEVVAPSSIPKAHGNQVKADRLDAGKLARYYDLGLLTIVSVPDQEQERDRDLIRSRQLIYRKLSEVRTHILSMLRRNGIHYKQETGAKVHWTINHKCWLDRKIDAVDGSLKLNLQLLVEQMKFLEHTVSEYNRGIEELATSARYKNKVQSLVCYHGIKNLKTKTLWNNKMWKPLFKNRLSGGQSKNTEQQTYFRRS